MRKDFKYAHKFTEAKPSGAGEVGQLHGNSFLFIQFDAHKDEDK